MDLPASKARIEEVGNPASAVVCHFNPATISFGKSAQYKRGPNQGAHGDPPVQYVGTQATTLKLQLLFDAVEKQPGGSVLPEVERLLGWLRPPDGTTQASASPAELRFTWGSLAINGEKTFKGYLSNVEVAYQLFDRSGTPLRAQVDLTMTSVATEVTGTNPTSGAERGRRRHVLRVGESLQSVAQDSLGTPTAWRTLAALNGIDDPTRVAPGVELLVPDRGEWQEPTR